MACTCNSSKFTCIHFFSIKGKGYLQGVCYDINKYIRGISLSSFSTNSKWLNSRQVILRGEGSIVTVVIEV